MADVTCHGELLGMAQLSVSLGLSAALDIAVRTFTVPVLWFVLQVTPMHFNFVTFATRKGRKSR